MDSYHECLQEYGEGLEVVQICLEPEDASIKDEEISAIGDLSLDECHNTKSKTSVNGDNNCNIINIKSEDKIVTVNGNETFKCSKSDESLDNHEHDDDMTITEDDVLLTPRELTDVRRMSIEKKVGDRSLSKQQSRDISTSDEMVFAVTPTGLERISFEKYWKESDINRIEYHKTTLEKVKSDESWKECLNSPNDDTLSYCDTTARLSVQENSSLLYIDHDVDGYETCLDDDSYSIMYSEKTDDHKKINGSDHRADIKVERKQDKITVSRNKDNDASAKSICKESRVTFCGDEDVSFEHSHVQEHIIKQMKSLRIEPLNFNISSKKLKKRSPTKPSKIVQKRQQCIEYYNDQAECLEEYNRQKKLEEEKRNNKIEEKKILESNLAVIEKKLQLKKQMPSEDSTDMETNYVPGCHKCFLENYAYAITKAYIEEATACKYCEVIRDMLEPPKRLPRRRMSAPALICLDNGVNSETDDEDFLTVPDVKDRRKSAGPLKFFVPSRRQRLVFLYYAFIIFNVCLSYTFLIL